MPYIGYSSFYRMNPKIETARSEKKKEEIQEALRSGKKETKKDGY